MAWQTPTLPALVTDTQRAINAAMPGADAALARNNLAPVAKILAGGLFELHRFAAWAANQRFVHLADDDQLDRHGAEMKPPVPRRLATAASGLVTVAATGAVTVETGAVLTRSDGAEFVVDAGVVLTGSGTATVAATSLLPGAAGVTAASTTLAAASGVTGVATFAVDAGGLGGGADLETNAAYRSRLLFAKAYPDHGGSPPDWARYTLAVPGVTRVFIDPLAAGRGTVVVYPMFDDTRPNGIGLESDRLVVESALRVSGPGAGLPIVRLPVGVPVDMVLTDIEPATPEVFAAVTEEIAMTFAANARVAGVSDVHPSMPFLASPAKWSRSWIWQAAANATGEQAHVVATPLADLVLAEGEIAIPGALDIG